MFIGLCMVSSCKVAYHNITIVTYTFHRQKQQKPRSWAAFDLQRKPDNEIFHLIQFSVKFKVELIIFRC